MAKKLNEISSLPQIVSAFNGWFQPITLEKITVSIIDFVPVNIIDKITINGVIQPLKPSELIIKPIEQRAWNWLQIHCYPTESINQGDILRIRNKNYKVILTNNFDDYNYQEMHIAEQFQ